MEHESLFHILNILSPLVYIILVLLALALYRYALIGLGYLLFGSALVVLVAGMLLWLAFVYLRDKFYALENVISASFRQ